MISEKLTEAIEKEGKENGFYIYRAQNIPMSDDYVFQILLARDVPKYPELKPQRETFLCKIGLHKWAAWSERARTIAGVIIGEIIQTRECERCGIISGRKILS